MLARTFKDMGHEVAFIIDDEQRLNRPENRYADISQPYPNWIKDFSPFPIWLVSNIIDLETKLHIISILKTCDFIILNGYAVRFADEIGVPHLAMLTGSDLKPLADHAHAKDLFKVYVNMLYEKGFIKKNTATHFVMKSLAPVKLYSGILSLAGRNGYTNLEYFRSISLFTDLGFIANYNNWLKNEIQRQRNSIKNAFAYTFFLPGIVPDGDKLLKEIGTDPAKMIHCFMIDVDSISYTESPANKTVRVFNLARFNWYKDKNQPKDFLPSMDYKGNDIMIKGLALFANKYPNEKLDIRLVKKGKDVERTVELSKELGIDKYITWLNELSQKEILQEYVGSDIVFDQLAQSVVAMGGFEVMALGRPLIANARPEIFEPFLGESSAICHAQTPEEVCNWLEKLVFSAELRKETGIKSRQFVEKHFSTTRMANDVLKAFENYSSLKQAA